MLQSNNIATIATFCCNNNKFDLSRLASMECFDPAQGLTKECIASIMQSMAEGLLMVDQSGVIRFCNHGLEVMTGVPAREIIGKKCSDIMLCSCGSMKECPLLTSGTINNQECRLKRSDGTHLPVLKNGRAILNETGSVVGGVETLTDISALKKAEHKNTVLEERVNREGGGFHLLIGKSAAMEQVFELVELAAASSATVLITGETGTGKELAAHTIHAHGARSGGPLVKVNCSALPEPLLESELFGHIRGAFTGAIKDKIGRFELADGGTLFLDEIGDLSPYIQVKLLRFLQEREFERVGESITRKSDTRIIAATNRDLRGLVRSGDFREDLFYRLKVFPIHLPPLRERKDDINLLISHFLKKFNAQTGKSITGLTSEAALTVMDYCWPGNIRELENAVEHAFVTCREKEIGIFDLPIEIRRVEMRSASCLPPSGGNGSERKKNKIDPDSLRSALERFKGNRSKAAQALGIDRTTLWRLMKRNGILA
jgi:two-component system, NtrC family, response regulator HydG